MAPSNIVKTLGDGTIAITDTAITYTVSLEAGDFAFADPKPARTVIYDRHDIAGLRTGQKPVITGTFTVHFTQFTDAGSGDYCMFDIVNGGGSWGTSATSTASAAYEQKLHNMTYTVEGTSLGDSADHVVTFQKCLFVASFSEGDPSSVSISFECYGGVTYSGPA